MSVQPMRHRRTLALALAAVLLAAACTSGTTSPATNPSPSAPVSAIAAHEVPLGATAPVDDATWALAARIAAPAYTGDSTDAFKAALARAGIAVVADTSTDPATASPEVPLTGPASPVELLDFQAHALAVGVWSGTTFGGADLDSIAPVPSDSGSPSLSELLAGYAATADTPRRHHPRLPAGQHLIHPEAVRFAAAALFFFASDVATDGGRLASPSTSPSSSSSPAARLLPLAGQGPVVAQPAISLGLICGGPSAWIDGIVQTIVLAVAAAVPERRGVVVAIFGWIIHTVANLVSSRHPSWARC
jgi:hypothetical protein